MKIVIAIDSLKGCLSSAEACQAAGEGARLRWPEAEVVCLLSAGFTSVRCINPPALPLSTAMQPEVARQNIRDAVASIRLGTQTA